MPQGTTPPGSSDWLSPWLLSSLQDLRGALGELAGLVKSHHEATNRRIDDFRDEMVGRLAKRTDRAWEIAKGLPWRHIITLGPLIVLGLLGHVGPDEWKRWLLGG